MIKIERTFTFTNQYKDGATEKAELIMNKLESHIKLYIKGHKRLFDQFMEMGLEDLQDIFKEHGTKPTADTISRSLH